MAKEIAVFGGGCFWCTEAVFKDLRGVTGTMPGYAGGSKPDPTYEAVCGGKTGHAEVTKIEFDPSLISFEDLLTVFFAVHDPTTLNRQGNDVGTQYRSIILYTSDSQKKQAEEFIRKLDQDEPAAEKTAPRVVTELKSLDKFYPAEDYHRDYFAKNPNQPYCQLVISPKLKKLKERFGALLAKE